MAKLFIFFTLLCLSFIYCHGEITAKFDDFEKIMPEKYTALKIGEKKEFKVNFYENDKAIPEDDITINKAEVTFKPKSTKVFETVYDEKTKSVVLTAKKVGEESLFIGYTFDVTIKSSNKQETIKVAVGPANFVVTNEDGSMGSDAVSFIRKYSLGLSAVLILLSMITLY